MRAMARMSALIICLVTTLLGGCTFRKLAFRHADLIAYYEANDAFDLTGVQKKQLHPEIDKTLDWIRQEPLPLVVTDLEKFANESEDGLTEAEVDEFLAAFEERRKQVLSHVVKMGTPMLVTLSNEQIEHLAEEMDEDNEDLEELVEAKDKAFAKRAQKMADKNVELYEDFLDELTPAQEEMIRAAMAPTPEGARMALQARRESQQSFLTLLKEEKDSAKLEGTLLQWVQKPDLMGSPVVRDNREKRRQRHRDLLLALDKTLTKEQRVHARKTWSEHIANLREEIRPK